MRILKCSHCDGYGNLLHEGMLTPEPCPSCLGSGIPWEGETPRRHPEAPARVAEEAAQSTCQKRVTVCVISGAFGRVLAVESNRCAPEGGKCHRLGVVQGKAGYPSDSTCNWQHAERRAVNALGPTDKARRAEIYGHDFPCDDCEQALRRAGVKDITCIPLLDGGIVGLRAS